MKRIEFLLEVKENLTNQLSCISNSFVSNTPNERFRDEWERVQERLKIVNDLLKDEKQKNLPEQNQKEEIECIEFNFIDENFGEEVKNTVLFSKDQFLIISIFGSDLFIKKYDATTDLLKEFIANRNELKILRQERKELQKEIEELEAKNNEKKNNKI